MSDHLQACLNTAAHRAKVAETQLRLITKLQAKLQRTNVDDQMPFLFKIEAML